jgi:hypothetical protein
VVEVVATINEEDNTQKWENTVKTIEIEIMDNPIINKEVTKTSMAGKDSNMVKIKEEVCTRIQIEE